MSKLINYHCEVEFTGKGKASNVEEFFQEVIQSQFKNKQGIIKIHQELLKYIESPEAVFFLRQHFTESKGNYGLLRRGFLSKYTCGRSVSFCDNTFAMLFNGPKLNNDFYTSDDLHGLFNQEKLIFYFKSTSNERELAYYNSNGVKRLKYNSRGWTLAHIKPVGKEYNQGNIKQMFPCLDRELWNNSQKINIINKELNTEELSLLKAHFLRLVHPLNSFLLPKNNLVSYVGKGKRLGEEQELLKYVHDYLKREFKQEFKELESIMGESEFQVITQPISSIVWLTDMKEIRKFKKQNSTKKATEAFKENESAVEEVVAIKLDNWLKSVGKRVFRDVLYPAIKNNPDITYTELARVDSHFGSYKESSQKSRLSTAKSIFINGLEEEALLIIEASKRVI